MLPTFCNCRITMFGASFGLSATGTTDCMRLRAAAFPQRGRINSFEETTDDEALEVD